MTLAALSKIEVLQNLFGGAKLINFGRIIRQIWPSFPRGKGDQNQLYSEHVAYFLTLLSYCDFATMEELIPAHRVVMNDLKNDNGDLFYIQLGHILNLSDEVDQVIIAKGYNHARIIQKDENSEIFGLLKFQKPVQQLTIYSGDFLKNLSEQIHEYKPKALKRSFVLGSNKQILESDGVTLVGIHQLDNTVSNNGKVVARIKGNNLIPA